MSADPDKIEITLSSQVDFDDDQNYNQASSGAPVAGRQAYATYNAGG